MASRTDEQKKAITRLRNHASAKMSWWTRAYLVHQWRVDALAVIAMLDELDVDMADLERYRRTHPRREPTSDREREQLAEIRAVYVRRFGHEPR